MNFPLKNCACDGSLNLTLNQLSHMRQLVQRQVEGAIASAILQGKVHGGESMIVGVVEGRISVRLEEAPVALFTRSLA